MNKAQEWLEEAQSHAKDALNDDQAASQQMDQARAIIRACNNARGYDDRD